MKLEDYLEKKKLNKKKREEEESSYRQSCLKCLRSSKSCFCKEIDSFTLKTRFVFLMHPKEAKKNKTGTGRLTHLCLNNSEILIGEHFDNHPRFQEILKSPTYTHFILYPGVGAHNISNTPLTVNFLEKPPLIFIIDAIPCCFRIYCTVTPWTYGSVTIPLNIPLFLSLVFLFLILLLFSYFSNSPLRVTTLLQSLGDMLLFFPSAIWFCDNVRTYV